MRQRLGASRSIDRDRGTVAILVALLMPVLLGFVALALDLAAIPLVRGQMQNGVDAAALAVAQQCATGDCPADMQGTVEWYVAANSSLEVQVTYEVDGSQVWVEAAGEKGHTFAPIIGVRSTPVRAVAAATWDPTVHLTQ